VLGYTVAAMVALVIAGLSLYHEIKHGFEIEDAENLGDHVRMLRREMAQRPNDLSAATEIVTEAANERRVEKCYGRLMQEDGSILVETPGFAAFAPADGRFPRPVRLSEDVTQVESSLTRGGIPTFIVAARVGRGSKGSPLVYQVVMDATRVESWLRNYRVEFSVLVVGGTLLSGIVAWLITLQGLRPLRQIIGTAQRVTASGMSERLGGSRRPRELAALATEFDKMLERLSESFQRLALFSADAAHEFRTPLNNLTMATSLTLSRERTSEEYRHALAGNLEEFERLGRMVDRLLFLARADNAETVLHKTVLDATGIAGGVLDYFSALAEERGVTLECKGQGRVFADETLLRQALTNLISNALRHTPRGGRVTVDVQAGESGCEITISDTGPGIPPEHWPRLFDRFYRADAARSSSGDAGAGLGLSIVKTIMDLHHGTVTLLHETADGASFRLVYPASDQASAGRALKQD